jgi:hypothetical protein
LSRDTIFQKGHEKLITFSVGNGGRNLPQDVRTVQGLLTQRRIPIKCDGYCGPKTISAIKQLQDGIGMQKPDGLIELGKRTWTALTNSTVRVNNPKVHKFGLDTQANQNPNPTPGVVVNQQSSGSGAEYPKYGIWWPLESNRIRPGGVYAYFRQSES